MAVNCPGGLRGDGTSDSLGGLTSNFGRFEEAAATADLGGGFKLLTLTFALSLLKLKCRKFDVGPFFVGLPLGLGLGLGGLVMPAQFDGSIL